MTQINNTLLATSQPMDLCKGFALFPTLGTLRAGISEGFSEGVLLNKNSHILALRGFFSFSYILILGICGPSYAIEFNLEGTGSGKSIDMKVSGDKMQAGFFIGITVEFPISGGLQYWRPDHWYTPWKGHWHDIGTFVITPRIDLLGLILFAIIKILGPDSSLSRVNNIVPGLIGSWGFVGNSNSGFATGNGTMIARPVMNIPINIIPFIPGVGEVDETLSKIGLKISSGPNLGIGIPVYTSLTRVELDGHAYEGLSWHGERFTASGDDDVPSQVNTIETRLTHQPDLTFLLGWFAAASLFKLFRISATINIDVLGILGLKIELGTYNNTLSNSVGSVSVDACNTCGAEQQAGRPVKVIFEEPEAGGGNT